MCHSVYKTGWIFTILSLQIIFTSILTPGKNHMAFSLIGYISDVCLCKDYVNRAQTDDRQPV